MNAGWTIGIIGGSGLYAIDALEDAEWRDVATSRRHGDRYPTGSCMAGSATSLRFLRRHGRWHRIPPHEVNARGNIDALERCGCTDLLAISSVGSLREELEPGRFVVVDQFIDRTVQRPPSFFGTGMVAHVSMAGPVCPRLSGLAAAAVTAAGGAVTEGKTYLAMEGPQFSTRAESLLYRQWGADVIGMTTMPEARLAREAELPCALVTAPDARDPAMFARLDAVAGVCCDRAKPQRDGITSGFSRAGRAKHRRRVPSNGLLMLSAMPSSYPRPSPRALPSRTAWLAIPSRGPDGRFRPPRSRRSR